MSDQPELFFVNLMQEVKAQATTYGEFTRTTLVENLACRLVDAEELQDWVPCFFDGRGRQNKHIGVDGYCDDELSLDGTLYVLLVEYREGLSSTTLSTADIRAAFGKALAFVLEAGAGRLNDEILEPSTSAAGLARLIFEAKTAIRTLRVIVMSNARLGVGYREPEWSNIESMKVELHVWDLVRFQRLSAVGGREEIDIDVTAWVPEGLPTLSAGIGGLEYNAYLCVVPGSFLADIYERHGSRILEGNVRAFLSARGKVNKGMRKTIRSEPERFFAYNNGITATASKVAIGSNGNILQIIDLQIVNGGQTTASLYNTRAQDRISLEQIAVQMKLSVVTPDVALQIIPDISRFANTQNKVSEADLFANHPFNRRVEELSRQIWAPGQSGPGQMTHWFYERARAQYQTEQIKLTVAQKKTFFVQNPKSQVITKEGLAKVENTWRRMPHVVSLGSQKNFVKYAEMIGREFEADPTTFNERWFQHLVAKTILFTSTERIVSRAAWYSGDYRANIVTYSIAKLQEMIEDGFLGQTLNLDQIWKEQRLSKPLVAQMESLGEAVQAALVAMPEGWTMVSEWAKKEQCWQHIRGRAIVPNGELALTLKPIAEEAKEERRARKDATEVQTINAQIEVLRLAEAGYWSRALLSRDASRRLSDVELGIMKTAVDRGPRWVPTDAQAKRLMAAAQKLRDDGFE